MIRSLTLRALLALALATIVLGAGRFDRPRPAAAHPLGNFTVNRYARIEMNSDALRLRYVLDMAEIPAFQEIRTIDANRDGSVSDAESNAYLAAKVPELLVNLDLRVGGHRVELAAGLASISFPEGQGGLQTLRLVFDASAPMAEAWANGAAAIFRDANYADRLGWREIVVRGGSGVALKESTVAAVDRSAELTAYPQDGLSSPLNIREASYHFAVDDAAAASASVSSPTPVVRDARRPANGFAGLVSKERLTPAFVGLALLVAVFWGAAHALEPGHGKTIVAAYLVGARSTPRHAVLLGLTVTATHTSSVFALGLFTLYASRFFPAEDLYLWVSVASGLLVVAMGAFLFVARLRSLHVMPSAGQVEDQLQAHAHHHAHGHTHSHVLTQPGLRGLVALGVSGGLLPCPTAVVVMLGAIALDRVTFGLALVIAFSVGLAGVLTGVGLVLVYAKRLISRPGRFSSLTGPRFAQAIIRLAPLASALVIAATGAILTGNALATAL